MNKLVGKPSLILGLILSILVLASVSAAYLQPYKIGKEYRLLKDYSETNGTQMIPLSLNKYQINVDTYQNGAVYDTAWLTSEQTTEIAVGAFEGYTMTIDGIPVKSGETVQIRLDSLKKDAYITFELLENRTDILRKFYIRTLPSSFPDLDVIAQAEAAHGSLCFAIDNFLVKMDHSGRILYYRMSSGASDFRKINRSGRIRYTFMETTGAKLVSDPAIAAYKGVVMDENYQVIDIIETTLPKEADGVRYGLCRYGFAYLEDGHCIVASAVPKKINSMPPEVSHDTLGVRIVDYCVQELSGGKLVWQWDSTDVPALFSYSTVGNDYYNEKALYADYAHLSGIEIDPTDGNYICSFRNLDALIKLNRTDGRSIWILGGAGDQFGLISAQKFSGQEQFSIQKNGDILVFSNGVQPGGTQKVPTGQTRVLKYRLDSKAGTAVVTEQYIGRNKLSMDCGSVNEDDSGRYVIGWGVTAQANAMLTEIDYATGKTTFELLKRDMGSTYYIDRAYPAE